MFFTALLTNPQSSLLPIPEEKGFNGTIFDCIEKALNTLGVSVASSVLYQIEKRYQFPREEFASRPIDLVKYLRAFLGASGSAVVERLIVKEIVTTFNLSSSRLNSSLEQVVEEARKGFLSA
jgi:hypothetical protein